MESEETPLSLGERLQRRRQEKGMTLSEIARRTRIRQAYLEAIEQDRYDALPGAAYLTGFVRIFGAELNLDADELLTLLPEKKQEPVDSPLFQKSEPVHMSSLRRKGGMYGPVGLLLGLFLLICLATMTWWLIPSDPPEPVLQSEQAAVEPPSPPSEIFSPSDEEAVTSNLVVEPPSAPVVAPVESVPVETASAPPREGVGVVIPAKGGVLELEAVGLSHVSLEIDGRPLRSYDLQNGSLLRWKIRKALLLKVDAPEKVRVRFEGKELPLESDGTLRLGKGSGGAS